jgi:hypothetical protein
MRLVLANRSGIESRGSLACAGDFSQARLQAGRFLQSSLATAERMWQALAREANARVAIAEDDRKRAQECIAKATSTMQGFELPLAA